MKRTYKPHWLEYTVIALYVLPYAFVALFLLGGAVAWLVVDVPKLPEEQIACQFYDDDWGYKTCIQNFRAHAK